MSKPTLQDLSNKTVTNCTIGTVQLPSGLHCGVAFDSSGALVEFEGELWESAEMALADIAQWVEYQDRGFFMV